MRIAISILTILLIQNLGVAQNEFLAKLPVIGYVSELGISPSKEIWMASTAGNVYYTKEFGDLWHIGPYGSLDPMVYISGETYERINFLSDDVLIISGFIQQSGKPDFIYRSQDKGKTWDKLVFGKSSWIDAAHFTMNGKGWMSGSSQLIYYTEDYGKTWVEKSKVEKKGNLRFSTIHFDKSQSTGLFGSFWNRIYRTTDNCETWERIETPLQQGKYEKISKEHKPDIRKIRILGDNYIVNQQGRVYYSKADNIEWLPLPTVVDFEVSDNLGYLITDDFKVQLIDQNFSKTWTSIKSLNNLPQAVKVIDSALYAYVDDEIFRVSPSAFEKSELLTADIPIPEPYTQINFKNEKYGFVGTDILRYDKNRWRRFLKSPFPIGNVAIFRDKLIIADLSLNTRLEVAVTSNELLNYDLPKDILGPNQKLKSLTIGLGSIGCFHHNDQTRVYKVKRNVLKLSGSGNFLNNMPKQIDLKVANRIISIANNSRLDELTLEDLMLQPSDYSSFKSFISKKELEIKKNGINRFEYGDPYQFPGEKTDFEFYKRVADSLSSIDNIIISDVFSTGYGNWSTTKIWHQLIFDFQNGAQLIISNSDDIPNYLYAPWVINFNGLEYKTNSLEIGRLINELTKGEFYEEHADDPKYAIFKIADFMYRRKLTNEN